MKIIIAGAYAIGTHLAKLLSRNNQDIVLIDEDEERLANISSDYDLMTMNASPSSLKTLKNAGAEDADLYIAVTPDENMNMNSCMIAKALGTKKTVAKINNNEFMEPKLGDFFENLGISSLIYPENLAARDIVNGLKMSWVRQRWDVHDGALIMLGIKLRETCEILNLFSISYILSLMITKTSSDANLTICMFIASSLLNNGISLYMFSTYLHVTNLVSPLYNNLNFSYFLNFISVSSLHILLPHT